MKILNQNLLIHLFLICLLQPFISKVVNNNDFTSNYIKKTRHHLASRSLRSSKRDLGLINGNTLGIAMGGRGVYKAMENRENQKRKLNGTLKMVKSQFFRAQVLSKRNKQLYKDMDSVLASLEDKVEDMGDDVYQKLSDFDNSVKSKLSGRSFLPTFSSLH